MTAAKPKTATTPVPERKGKSPDLITILSIDGGGIRGILPTLVLAEIERLAGRRVATLFDVIAGTSTGGMVALGITKPGPDGKSQFSAEEVLEFYTKRGLEIFPEASLKAWRASREAGVRAPLLQKIGAAVLPRRYGNARYFPGGLEKVLADGFGDAMIADALGNVLIPTYDWKAGRALVFNSREAREGTGPNVKMRDVARATTAAPTYFPPHRVQLEGGDEVVMIDGGVAANNPVSVAYYEALIFEERGGRDLDMLVVSLGTGRPPEEIPTFEQLWSRGWLSLGMGMLGVVFDGTSELQDDLMRKVITKKEPGSRYFRFQAELRGCSLALDDASATNISSLVSLGEKMVRDQRKDLERLVEMLLEQADG